MPASNLGKDCLVDVINQGTAGAEKTTAAAELSTTTMAATALCRGRGSANNNGGDSDGDGSTVRPQRRRTRMSYHLVSEQGEADASGIILDDRVQWKVGTRGEGV